MFRTAFRLPFRLLGIPLKLDVTFLIVLPIVAWTIGQNVPLYMRIFGIDAPPEALGGGAAPYALGFVAAIGLFASVVLHELGHAVAARRYGVKVRGITLWLLGGVAQFDEIPRRPGAEAVIAIAGPLVSFALAGLAFAVLPAVPEGAHAVAFVAAYVAYANLAVAIFNLLPALPLDGGRILRSLLALRMPRLRATLVSARVSRAIAIALGLLGFVTLNFFLMLIAFFVYVAVSAEAQGVALAEALGGVAARDLMTREVRTVAPETRIADLLHKMLHERFLSYPVVDGEGKVLGMVTLHHLRGADPQARAADVMTRKVAALRPDATASDSFDALGRSEAGRAVVLDEAGRLVGLISKTDLVRALQVRLVEAEMAPAAAASGRGPHPIPW